MTRPFPGLLPDVSYADLRSQSPQQFAGLLARKLADLGICQATDMKREPSKQ
jgi:hypothetical protein